MNRAEPITTDQIVKLVTEPKKWEDKSVEDVAKTFKCSVSSVKKVCKELDLVNVKICCTEPKSIKQRVKMALEKTNKKPVH